MKKKKALPRFKSEESERRFWAAEDSVDYLDWSKAVRATFPNLKPSLRTISLRLPASMLEQLKLLANRRDIPYQSLMKMFLDERIRQEMAPPRRADPIPYVTEEDNG